MGGELTIQYTDDILQNCTLKTYIINITTINLIKKTLTPGKFTPLPTVTREKNGLCSFHLPNLVRVDLFGGTLNKFKTL